MNERWYFTFGQSSQFRNKYVVFHGTRQEARQEMFNIYGEQWAFQYSEKDFEGQAERFGLTELF